MAEKTILGVKLRRLIITLINGFARDEMIKVRFRGTQAYTDGKQITLPAIRDLAEIPYSTARALIGYAIHEVSHVLYTDFEAIIRAIDAGKMEPDQLIKKFENAIEDYRIERLASTAMPGTASDLTALRNLIHPKPNALKKLWFADPRACGPLALTWTGSQLNGFVIPAMQATLDSFPEPVRKLIDNWTIRMTDVASTEEAVDLAIAFSAEAIAYANASRPQPQQSKDEQADQTQTDKTAEKDDAEAADQPGRPQNDEDAAEGSGASGETTSDSPDEPRNEATSANAQDKDKGEGEGESDDKNNDDGVDELNFDGKSNDKPNSKQNSGRQTPPDDPKGHIGMNDGMMDTFADQDEEEGGDAHEDDPLADALEENAAFDDFLDNLRDQIAATPLPEEMPDAKDGEIDPKSVISDLKIANRAAPNYTSADPDCQSPGENSASKNQYIDERFIPIDPDLSDDNQYATLRSKAAGVIGTTSRTIRRLLMAEEKRGVLRGRRDGKFDIRNISAVVRATGNCYKRNWERPAPETELFILADFSGSMKHGSTSIETPLSVAVTAALAVEEATRNTQIQTSIYGFQGMSPDVILYPFKEGKQAPTLTRRLIGSYHHLPLGCTPTGEAMAAVADKLDAVENKRKVLVILTDGCADDQNLCKDVIAVLNRRGIEVVAIGIECNSVLDWCSNSHVINDISQLPQALLATIDPRAQKKMKKAT